jgi:1-acyl-sn-glycerol-3-phosphate acyltransferase
MKGVFRAARAALGASSTNLDRFGQDADLIQQLSPIANFFYDRYWRVSVEGVENLPEGPVILVANHSGALPLDGPILRMAIRRRRPELCEARWLLEDAIFYLPVLGLLLNRIGAVRASAENALQLLDERRPVIVFPEGIQGISKTFTDRYQLRPFGRGGFVKVALRTRVPILPVAIFGAEESMPVLAKIPGGLLGLPDLPLAVPPLPTKWSIRFGAPIQVPADVAETDAAELQRWTENTRESIQQMLRSMLATRRSVFSG